MALNTSHAGHTSRRSSTILSTRPACALPLFALLLDGALTQSNSGPLGYVIFAEVSSAKLRSKTVGLGIWMNSLCGMLANIIIPYL